MPAHTFDPRKHRRRFDRLLALVQEAKATDYTIRQSEVSFHPSMHCKDENIGRQQVAVYNSLRRLEQKLYPPEPGANGEPVTPWATRYVWSLKEYKAGKAANRERVRLGEKPLPIVRRPKSLRDARDRYRGSEIAAVRVYVRPGEPLHVRDLNWGVFDRPIQNMMNAQDAILHHFGWLDELAPLPVKASERRKTQAGRGRKPFRARPISECLLEFLRESANEIERLVAEAKRAARGYTPHKEKGGKVKEDPLMEARNKWIYRECLKGKKMSYRRIIANLKKLASEKGWEVIESIPGIRVAANSYAKKHGKPSIPRRQQEE
jgi:hypothetical protein